MTESIKSVFDGEFTHVKIENSLLKRVREYGANFINRSPDHIAFFGGNLLGVDTVRFRDSDKSTWFDEVLDIDDYSIKNKIVSLPTVNPDWIRGTDVMNLSCFYLVHRIYNSQLLETVKYQGMIDTLMALHFKLISSLMAHYFPYSADPSVALATYAALTLKSDLKVHGTWYALLLNRCQDIIDPQASIHYDTIKKFDDDGAIQYMITDVQGRLRNIVKNLCTEFYKVRDHDAKIISSKAHVMIEGEAILKDMIRNLTPYKQYIREITPDEGVFIKAPLIGVVCNAMHTMNEKFLMVSLIHLSQNYGRDKDNQIEKYVDDVIQHAFNFLSADPANMNMLNNLGILITKLRANVMSSRSSDPLLIRIRDRSDVIVKAAIPSTNNTVIASVKTGVYLYIVLRCFALKFYT